MENLKDRVAEKQPTTPKHLCEIIKQVSVMKMTPKCCQALIGLFELRLSLKTEEDTQGIETFLIFFVLYSVLYFIYLSN